MATGSISGATNNEFIVARIEWSSTANLDENKSTVTAALYYRRTNSGYETSGQGTFSITINGITVTSTKELTITESSWVKAIENTVTVAHNANGTKSIDISARGSIPSTSMTSTLISGTAVLDIIPRETELHDLMCSTSYFNGKLTYKYLPKSSIYYNRCHISLNALGDMVPVKTIDLGRSTKSIESASVMLSEDELSIIYHRIPAHYAGVLRFTMLTYTDENYSDLVGDGEFLELQLSIPNIDETKPTATMTLSAVNTLPAPFNTLYIRGRSKVQATFTDGKGKYGSAIDSYRFLAEGELFGPPYISKFLATEGTRRVSGFVVDSRGFSRTYSQDIEVLTYSAPMVIPVSGESSVICARCDSSGTFSEAGTYIRIKAQRRYSTLVSGGTQYNFCKLQYRYKKQGGSWSSWADILGTTDAGNEVDTGALLGTIEATSSYSVQIQAVDDMGESTSTTVLVPTERIYCHRAGSRNSFAFGKYVEEEDTFDFSEDITVKVRGGIQFVAEAWESLGLSASVNESDTPSGRGSGCFYRVCAGESHIYVSFNCSFTTGSSTVRVNANAIPSAYRPPHNIYVLCAVGYADGGRGLATVGISPAGEVNIYAVHRLSGTAPSGETVKWIDGYIDYWT